MIKIKDMAGAGRTIQCRRLVIKLGSSVVMGEDNHVDRAIIEDLANTIVELHKKRVDVILVTSGAIGLACDQLKKKRPKIIPEKQAYAAIGQIGLMHVYQEILAKRGLVAAQLLLTRSDMEDRARYLNARHAIDRLLSLDAVPIINENDSIATDELSFGDNDMLSSYVAVKMKADLLVLLSSVAGVMTAPPDASGDAKTRQLVKVIEKIGSSAFAHVDDSRSDHGSGGMKSKLLSSRSACEAGVHTVIACGKTPGIVRSILTGEFDGTYMPATRDGNLSALERWIAFGRAPKDRRLLLDSGAVDALLNRNRSLLPVGVKTLNGKFKRGDVVEVCDPTGSSVARGLVNYSSEEVEKIRGRKASEIESILGYRSYDEIIHRNNLVILQAD